jgi:hypothetical protein
VYSDAKVANRYVTDFGWAIAHAAVSRCTLISLDTMLARTHMYTHAAKVWDLSIAQGPFSVAPCQTLALRFATFASLYTACTWSSHPCECWCWPWSKVEFLRRGVSPAPPIGARPSLTRLVPAPRRVLGEAGLPRSADGAGGGALVRRAATQRRP